MILLNKIHLMSENRRIKRYLLRRAKRGRLRKGDTESCFLDNRGIEYPYAWEAKFSSFCNFVSGCFKNGFPVVVPKLWYTAWAFYPFFFVRRNLGVKDPVATLNHERIHIRQQRDIHLTISFPIIVLCGFAELFGWFNPFYLLCIVPFIPAIVYGFAMFFVSIGLLIRYENITFDSIRENTCFEQESIVNATNKDYLLNRKFWAVLSYIKILL